MWFLIAAFAVGFFATLLLAPKMKTQDATASQLEDLNFPKASEGSTGTWVIGKVRIKGPNTLWVGDFEARPIKKKQKTGLFSSKRVIIGYEYFVGMVLGLCLGPGVTLHRIWSAKDEIWSGTANTDGTAISINLPKLYGGKEKGGGFIGTLRFYTGGFTQGINAYYADKRGEAVTAYRGTSYIVLEHPNIGEANQLREMSFEVSRYPNDLGIPDGKHIIGEDANPMEALYQVLVSPWGGLNVNTALLDLDSMVAAAEVLFDEGNGMSMQIVGGSGKAVISDIMRQIDAILYNDPVTGKIVVKLIRDDFGDIESLPVFDESNIKSVRAFSRTLWEDTINKVHVTFTNRAKKYERGTAMQDDMANINAQGRVRPTTNDYKWCCEADLANTLCSRDLSQLSIPLISAQIETNRDGAALKPGDRFVWSWSEYNIDQIVMRVRKFDPGALTENRVVMDIIQDRFAIADTLLSAPDNNDNSLTSPDLPATDVVDWTVREAPFFFASVAGIAAGSTQSVLLVAASAPANADEFDVFVSTDGGVTYSESEQGLVFGPVGTLNTAITATSDLSDGVISSLVVTVDPDEIEQNTASGAAQGAGMFLIGNELFVYETRTVGVGQVTLNNVWRAILDSSPADHNIADKVYFLSGDNVVDDLFPGTASLRVKLLPSTFNDQLDLSAATHKSLTLRNRSARPLPPRAVKFGGGAFFAPPANGASPVSLTWANADRQSQVVRKIVDTTNEYEAGQETVIRWRVNGGAWSSRTCAPGVTSASIVTGATASDTVDFEIYASRDGLESIARWAFTSGTSAGSSISPDTGGAPPADTTPPYAAPADSLTILFPFGENIGTYPIDVPITFAMRIADDFAGSNADVRTNPASTALFTVQRNGSAIGSVSISTSGVATFTTTSAAIDLFPGDTLSITPPATIDVSLKGVTISLAAERVTA